MPLAIHCPCGVQVLLADTITHLQGPCPNCGRPLAVKLGRKLQELEVFNNRGAKTVVVSKAGDGFEVRLFVAAWVGGPPVHVGPLDWLRLLLSAEVFDGSHVRLVVCDQGNRVLRVLD